MTTAIDETDPSPRMRIEYGRRLLKGANKRRLTFNRGRINSWPKSGLRKLSRIGHWSGVDLSTPSNSYVSPTFLTDIPNCPASIY